jgi:hypothetical protein
VSFDTRIFGFRRVLAASGMGFSPVWDCLAPWPRRRAGHADPGWPRPGRLARGRQLPGSLTENTRGAGLNHPAARHVHSRWIFPLAAGRSHRNRPAPEHRPFDAAGGWHANPVKVLVIAASLLTTCPSASAPASAATSFDEPWALTVKDYLGGAATVSVTINTNYS